MGRNPVGGGAERTGWTGGRSKAAAGVAWSALVVVAVACGSGSGSSGPADQAFLADVHADAPDISQYRSDLQLARLGQAVCADFAAGASYEAVADRLGVSAGAATLPSGDLGAVITSAADDLCPRYRTQVGGG